MSKSKSQKILAIDPGTRNIGVAFLEGTELIYFGVKTIRQKKSSAEVLQEGKKIIHRPIKDFKPTTLVVEKTFFPNNRNSITLNTLAKEIQKIGKSHRLKVLVIAANTVRKNICGNGLASKNEVAKVVVARFPELKPYLTSDRRWKEKFHRNMFDAIALGLMILSAKNN